jgi:Flp pilus assembly protein TadB
VFDLTTRQKLNRGYSDGLARALEIVVTPLLLGFLGRVVDGWLGTRPLFMLALGTFGAAGIVVKLWLGYDREMRKHEAELPGARRADEVGGTA